MSVLESFKQLKAEGTKIVVVTSHEYWSAKILNDTDINGILIGDDLNMVVHGHEDTLSCDVETIAMHTRAVKKGAKDKFLIAVFHLGGAGHHDPVLCPVVMHLHR